MDRFCQRESRGEEAGGGLALRLVWTFLWMDRAVGQGFLPAVVVRPVRVARATGVREEEGQGRVTGTGPASRCDHTSGLPWSDSSPVRCRGSGEVPGKGRHCLLRRACAGRVLCSAPRQSGSGKTGPSHAWCQGLIHHDLPPSFMRHLTKPACRGWGFSGGPDGEDRTGPPLKTLAWRSS